MLFIYKPANPEPDPATSLTELLDSRPLFLCLIILGPSSGHPGTARPPRLDNRKPAYPAWCVPSQENTVKTLAHSSPLPLCLLPGLVLPHVALHGLGQPLYLQSVRLTNCLSNGNHLLIRWLTLPE